MTQKSESGRKAVFLAKVRLEPERLGRYEAAYQAARERSPDLTFASWVRAALDAAAASARR